MLQRSFSLLFLLATCFAEFYPLHEVAVRDPRSFDLLYSSTSGPHNETWNFRNPANLTAVIIPSQVFNFSFGGLWPEGTYAEDLQVLVYETSLDGSPAGPTLVGRGVFSGSAYFGRELRVTVTTDDNTAIPVQEYLYVNRGWSYTFSIIFGSVGFYPWYNTRKLSSYSAVHLSSNEGGIALGIAFSDG